MPAMLSSMPVYPNSGSHSKIMVCRRWCLAMPPVGSNHRAVTLPPVLRETESTSLSHQFRSGTGSSTVAWARTLCHSLHSLHSYSCLCHSLHSYTREWVWCTIFLDRIALIKPTLSVIIRHLSGGCMTSAMCRRAVKRALSSTVKTPAGPLILYPNPLTPIWCTAKHTSLNQRVIRIKMHDRPFPDVTAVSSSRGGRSCFLVNSITFDFEADIVKPTEEKKTFNDVQAVWTSPRATLFFSVNACDNFLVALSPNFYKHGKVIQKM
jgi:hypothetical protein